MRVALVLIALASCGEADAGRPVIGDERWAVTVGSAASGISSVAIDSDGDVVIGGWLRPTVSEEPTGFVSKLRSTTGANAWTRSLTGGYTWVAQIAVGPDGSLAACGTFQGSVDFGGSTLDAAGEAEMFVAAYDASGGLRWVRSLGPGARGEPWDVAVGMDGAVVTTGWYVGTLAGAASDDIDAFVAAHDTDGNVSWVDVDPSPGRQYGSAIAAARDGDIVIAGALAASVARLAPSGAPRWTTQLPASGPRALTIEDNGDTLLAGKENDVETWMRRIDASGTEIAAYDPVEGNLIPRSLALVRDGTIVIGGSVDGEMSFGDARLPDGAVIAAVDADGLMVDARSVAAHGQLRDLAVAADGAIAFVADTAVVVLDASPLASRSR